MGRSLLLGIELHGSGIHPAAWRRTDSRAEELFTARYWRDLIGAVDDAGLDFVVIPDSFALQQGGTGVERGRLDAVAVAATSVAATRSIGLIPQAPVTHTEPFHISKALASLDYASRGRGGWEVTVSTGAPQAKLFGRKAAQDDESLWAEADDAIEVVTRLWDSWEDDAEIRDIPTGRFIDRDKLHYIDFVGDHFSVKGPSITPRPPQGQLPIVVRWSGAPSSAVAAARADVVRIAATDAESARAQRESIRHRLAEIGRGADDVSVLVDVEVHLAGTRAAAVDEVRQLESWAGQPFPAESLRFVGSAGELAEFLEHIPADGVVLRPLAAPAAVAQLATAQQFRSARAATLRERLGLTRPRNRYARSSHAER